MLKFVKKGILIMTQTIVIQGYKKEVLSQLSKYMSIGDAKKFFNFYFEENYLINDFQEDLININSVIPLGKKNITNIENDYTNYFPKDGKCLRYKKNEPNLIYNDQIMSSIDECFGNIDGKSITINNKRNKFFKKMSITIFIAIAVVLYIKLNFAVGYPLVTNIMALVSTIPALLPENKNKLADCIISVVRKLGYLPQYSKFSRSNCKNLNVNCPYHRKEKCSITEEAYINVVSELIKNKVLVENNKHDAVVQKE